MRFAQSLDDNALAAVAGLVTAVVAGTTAFFSGYSVFRYEKDTFVAVEYDTPIILPTSIALDMTESAAYFHMTGSEDTGGTGGTSSVSLCDRVEATGDGVDDMNEDLDILLYDLKTRKNQRRK